MQGGSHEDSGNTGAEQDESKKRKRSSVVKKEPQARKRRRVEEEASVPKVKTEPLRNGNQRAKLREEIKDEKEEKDNFENLQSSDLNPSLPSCPLSLPRATLANQHSGESWSNIEEVDEKTDVSQEEDGLGYHPPSDNHETSSSADGGQKNQSRVKRCRTVPVDGTANMYPSGDFERGQIVQLKVKNWVTFHSAVLSPICGLNFIVAPNGAGKSALISAICIVLGGKTKALGRGSSREKDFIKRGTKRALIEIRLHRAIKGSRDEWYDAVITRAVSQKQSYTYVNGERWTSKELNTLTKKLNIKVENPCQFLSQDRVQVFAALTDKERLRETMKAMDTGHLFEEFSSLIELSKKNKSYTLELEQKEKHQVKLKERNDEIEDVVVAYKALKEKKDGLELLKNMRYWIVLRHLKDMAQKEEETCKNYRQECIKKIAYLKPLKEKKRKLMPVMNGANKLVKKYRLKMDAADKLNGSKGSEKVSAVLDRVGSLKEALSNLNLKVEEYEAQKAALIERIAEYEEKRKALPLWEDLEKDLEAFQGELSRLRHEDRRLENKCDMIRDQKNQLREDIKHIQDKKVKLQSQKNQKVRRLFNGRPKDYRFWNHMKEQKHLFKQSVIGPVGLYIDVEDRLSAHFVENVINDRVFTYLTNSTEDQRTLNMEAKKFGLKIRIYCLERTKPRETKWDSKMRKYRKNGVEDVVLNLVKNPSEQIYNWLISDMSMDQIFYSKKELSQHQLNVVLMSAQDPQGIRTLLNPRSLTRASISRYGNRARMLSTSSMNQQLRFITPAKSEDLQKQLQEQDMKIEKLMEELQSLDKTEKAIKAELGPLKQSLAQTVRDRAQIREQIHDHKTLNKKMHQRKTHLSNLIKPNIEKESDRIKADIKRCVANMVKEMRKMVLIFGKVVEFNDNYHIPKQILKKAQIECKHWKSVYDQAAKSHQDLSAQLKLLEKKVLQSRADRDRAKEHANRLAPLSTLSAHQLFEEYSPWMQKDIGEVNKKIMKMEHAVAQADTFDASELVQYERRVEQIRGYDAVLAKLRTNLENTNERIVTKNRVFEPKLKAKISQISQKFSDFMTRFDAKGECKLQKFDEYENWELHVLVSYRPDDAYSKLQRLSATCQSGGEKSVATMVFLLSMQQVSITPFRVVDEINQGMDSHNERIVMNLLAENMEKRAEGTSSQFFVVSPKIIQNPTFLEKTNTLCHTIFNGSMVEPGIDNVHPRDILASVRKMRNISG